MLNISDERARTKMGILSVRFIEYLTVFIIAHSRSASEVDTMLEVGVAHTLKTHLQRVVVLDIYAVSLAPRSDSRE